MPQSSRIIRGTIVTLPLVTLRYLSCLTFGGVGGTTGGLGVFGRDTFHRAVGSYGVPQLSPSRMPHASSGFNTRFVATPINSSCIGKQNA